MQMDSTATRFELIEIGRGIAALLVVCFHATVTIALPKYFGQSPLGGMFSFGYAGVDFFFVLSGFIIFYSTAKNHGNPTVILSYIKHRLIRIYPIYWVVCLVLLPLTYLVGYRVGAINAMMDFLLLPREGHPFVVVAWTLRHEMLFYISFLLFFLNITLAWGYFLLWGGAIAMCSLLSLDFISPIPSLYLSDHNLEFLLGMGIAHYAKAIQESWIKPFAMLLAGLAIFLAAGLNESLINVRKYFEHGHYHLLYGIGAVLMVGGLVQLKADLSNLWVRVGMFLGRASYSIYLIHFAVLSVAVKLLMPLHLPLWLNMGLSVLAVLVIGSLLYQWVERPMLARIRGKLGKR
jgi:peptidoglycan/LPS O-acetylase OafA/YrhL